MAKKMLIDATHAEETRVVVVDGNKVEEFDFESLNKRQIAGNIYLAKVTRVEPSLQAAFIDYGGNRHGFLAFSEIHPDYYQIPVEDRQALIEEEERIAKEEAAEEEAKEKSRGRSRTRRRKPAEAAKDGAASQDDAIVSEDVVSEDTTDATETGAEDTQVVADNEAPVAESDVSVAEASGEVEVEAADVAEDTDADEAATSDEDISDETEENGDVESVAAEDVEEEIVRRKPRQRRYKIQEVIKVRQILLVQVVKEERGNKGAALTTYLSLAGRYCVLMPNTARGGGISRKITNAVDRKKLKDIANSIAVPKGAGLIIRTAGANRTKAEIKRDYEYLLRQWEQIRDLTLKSIAPTQIYEEGSLIKRVIRDLYSREIDEIWVDGERGYREAKDYMKMLMPSHAKNVKHYTDMLPLFSRFQVEAYLSGMFNPTVQLKSGGYIVIGVTEALVAIDVNSGRATRENSIEDTALKTNLEAAEEVARQLRLRDLAGLIVIDFIDMDERRNNAAVEKRMKDRLKSDRARIQVGRISSFGLMEMSRQRLRPGMIEATTQPCPHCHGTGITRSDDSMSLAILRELEEEGVRRRCKEVLVSVPIDIANYMLNQKREHVAMIESRFGLSVRIEADAHLISPEYRLERLKTATRIIPEPEAFTGGISFESAIEEAEPVEDEVEEIVETVETVETPEGDSADDQNRKKRRRRRRRGGKNRNGEGNGTDSENATDSENDGAAIEGEAGSDEAAPAPQEAAQEKPKRSRSRRRSPKSDDMETSNDVIDVSSEVPEIVEVPEGRTQEAAIEPAVSETVAVEAPTEVSEPAPAEVETPEAETSETPAEAVEPTEKAPVPQQAEPEPEPTPEPQPAEPEPEPAMAEPEPEPKPAAPKKRGWWSI
ncbi:MAG TPA: Rne/Rng family ribonuclease [Paracoccaceae bacterium]|nr:Rne/Rng family ribonuclease [Paracoccaceae bacterium]